MTFYNIDARLENDPNRIFLYFFYNENLPSREGYTLLNTIGLRAQKLPHFPPAWKTLAAGHAISILIKYILNGG